MLVTVNCYLTASPSPLVHLTRIMNSINSLSVDPEEADLILSSVGSCIRIHASLLCPLSPLLSSLILSSSPSTIILPESKPGSLPLARELLYTGQCKGTFDQLEDALLILSLLGVQIQTEAEEVGGCDDGGVPQDVSFILGCESSNESHSTSIEDVMESIAAESEDVTRLPFDETYSRELFASFATGEDAADTGFNLSDIQMDNNPDFEKVESLEKRQEPAKIKDVTQEEEIGRKDVKRRLQTDGVSTLTPCYHSKPFFECSHCQYKTKSNSNMKRHLNAKHTATDQHKLECEVSNLIEAESKSNVAILLSDEELEELKESNLEQKEDISSTHEPTCKVVFPCNVCSYVATQNGHLKRHEKSKHSKERFECKFCKKIYTFNESLRRHVKEAHDDNQQSFPCPECSFVGRRQEILNYHVQWKHSEEIFSCDECGHQAATARLIKRHKLRVHRGVTYNCDNCDYVASDKSSLSYHQKSKHDQIRYQCDVCTKKFTKTTSLKMHMKTVHKNDSK